MYSCKNTQIILHIHITVCCCFFCCSGNTLVNLVGFNPRCPYQETLSCGDSISRDSFDNCPFQHKLKTFFQELIRQEYLINAQTPILWNYRDCGGAETADCAECLSGFVLLLAKITDVIFSAICCSTLNTCMLALMSHQHLNNSKTPFFSVDWPDPRLHKNDHAVPSVLAFN